jgi:hypothetical protein
MDEELIENENADLLQYDDKIDIEKEKRREKIKKIREEQVSYEAIIVTESGEVKTAHQLSYDEQLVEISRCAFDPVYFIETYLTVFDQMQGDGGEIVPFKLFPSQKKLVSEYQKHRFNIANKYRQAGISTTTCAYLAWYLSFNEDRSIAIVANKLETAQNELMNDVVDFIESCPKWLRPSPDKKDTQKLKWYSNGCTLGAFSATAGLRGYTPTLIFWDETAWTNNSGKFWEAAGPTLQTGGGAIFVSTPAGLDEVFYKYFDGARKGINNFNAIELWWFNDPRYIRNRETNELELEWIKNPDRDNEIRLKDEDWSDEKRIQMMDDGWNAWTPWYQEQIQAANGDMRKISQELLCSFLGSGDNFISEKYLKHIEENTITTPIRQEYTDKNMWIWEDPEELEEYLMGIDVSSGHGDDNSTINIFKINQITEERIIYRNGKRKKIKVIIHKSTQVAEYYGKLSPQELGEVAYTYGMRYNNAYAVVDVTGGWGGQTVVKLFELGYEANRVHHSEITHKPTRDKLNGYIQQSTKKLPDGTDSKVDLVPGFWIGGNRGAVLTEMERVIRMDEIIINSVRLLNELKTFVTVTGSRVADHKRSFHDDSIMGMALSIYVANFEKLKYNISPTKTKKILEAMLKFNSGESETTKNNDKIRQQQQNPYGQHSWMMNGLKKR